MDLQKGDHQSEMALRPRRHGDQGHELKVWSERREAKAVRFVLGSSSQSKRARPEENFTTAAPSSTSTASGSPEETTILGRLKDTEHRIPSCLCLRLCLLPESDRQPKQHSLAKAKSWRSSQVLVFVRSQFPLRSTTAGPTTTTTTTPEPLSAFRNCQLEPQGSL